MAIAEKSQANYQQASKVDTVQAQEQEGIKGNVLRHSIDLQLPCSQEKNHPPSAKFGWNTFNGLANDSNKAPLGWRTMPYIMGNELAQNLASIGLQLNLIIYFTQQYHMGQVQGTNVLNISSGTSGLVSLLGAFLADACLGRFLTIFGSSIICLLGMVLLLLTATVRSLRPIPCPTDVTLPHLCHQPSESQMAFLVLALLLLAIGSGGLRPCTYAFGADQFNQNTTQGKKQLQSYFNWYYFCLSVTLLLSTTVIVYFQTDIGWGWGFGVPTIAMALSILIFVAGLPQYRHQPPTGSVFTGLLQVLVAAFRKRNLLLPSDENDLFQGKVNEKTDFDFQMQLMHTNEFRILDKAAIKTVGDVSDEDGSERKAWRLCTMQQIEELKCLLRIMPIWASRLMLATNLSQQIIYPVLQALTMDRHVLGSSFEIPEASIGVFGLLTLAIWVPLYDRLIVPVARRITGNVRGITLLQRMGIGCFLASIAMLVGGVVESKRKAIAQRSGLADNFGTPIPMSVFWLVPQSILLGIAESFHLIGQIEFFYDQMPASMRSVAGAAVSCSLALGSYLSSAILSAVHKATQRRGDWLANNLNRGHLDYFYYLLATMLAANLVVFLVIARYYTYKQVWVADSDGDNDTEMEGKP